MSIVVEKLASEGHLTPEQVERIGRNTAEIMKAAQEDTAVMADLQKLAAAAGGFFSHLPWKQTAGTLLAAAGIQAAAGVAGDAYQSIKSSINKARNYKGMLDQNPDLAQQDSKKVQRAFDTLHKFNPSYASDPSVAGQYVKDTFDLERVPIEQINQMVKARSDLAGAKRNEGGFSVGNLPTDVFTGGQPQSSQGQIDEMHQARMGSEDAKRRNLLGLP